MLDKGKKACSVFWQLYDNNSQFNNIIFLGVKNKKIRFLDESDIEDMKNVIIKSVAAKVSSLDEWFEQGYNYLKPRWTAYFLSLLYDEVDIVFGVTKFSDGGYYWLETETEIIDPRLMISIDKTYSAKLGYRECERKNHSNLVRDKKYRELKKEVLGTKENSKQK